jgi:hypothetical protein
LLNCSNDCLPLVMTLHLPKPPGHEPLAGRAPFRNAVRLVLGIAATVGIAGSALAQTAPPPGGSLVTSSDYIPGFVQYVRWPGDEGFRSWQVCVATARADGGAVYAGRTARGRPFSFRQVAPSDPLGDCNVLDLTGAPPAGVKPMLERARRLPVLTVGEGESFCTAGGVICLRPRDVGGFEVNLSALQEAGLIANAQLLMLGRKRQTAGAAP